jgi:signal transduction histidine kinase
VDTERVFDPYQRAEDAPGVVGSMGLGLTISRRLARLMEGDLTYRRSHGATVFELLLPTVEEVEGEFPLEAEAASGPR